MKIGVLAVAFIVTIGGIGAAAANPVCVQQTLTKLGYEPGPADGAIGPRTQAAAAEFATAAGLTLPELSPATSGEWCTALKRHAAGPEYADAKSVNGIFAFDLDVTSVPEGVLSEENQQALWNLHETSDRCLEYRRAYGSPRSYNLRLLPADVFAESVPQSPFPAAEPGLLACKPKGRQIARLNEVVTVDAPPPPLERLDDAAVREYREVYGDDHAMEEIIDFAGAWFARHLAAHRADPSGPDGEVVIERMVEWAEARAITRNIQVGGNDGPVIFAISTLGSSIVNAYVDLAPEMTPGQRALVGPWLNRFMRTLAANHDDFRTQNHAAGWAVMIATWGLATGDVEAVQYAIDTFKLAIHDMRPDGSFAQDHSRGANGLSYNNLITGDLVMLAGLLKTSLGADLFAYEVDGRSIHTAVDYAMGALEDPVAANLKYALPCPQAGDYNGRDRNNPFVDYNPARERMSFSLGAYLPAYALMFPERDVSKRILKGVPVALGMAQFHPFWHAAPICTFGLVPDPDLVKKVVISDSGAPQPPAE